MIFALVFVSIIGIQESVAEQIPSPRQQLEDGVSPDDIQCKENRVLVLRTNGNVACITERTVERTGWEIIPENQEITNVVITTDKSEYKQVEIIKNEFDLRLGQTSGVKPIPKGSFESAINISKVDADIFADKISKFIDTPYTKRTEISEGFRYDTNEGSIRVIGNGENITGFSFMSLPKGNTSFEEGKKITNELIKEFGIVLDGTEFQNHYTTAYGAHLFKYIQMKDGIFIDSNQIRLVFEPGITFITITNWNHNLSEMNLVDLDTVQQIGIDYAQTFETLRELPCDIKMEDRPLYANEISNTELRIINGTPVYVVYSGTCQLSSALVNQDFETTVNALTGEPLFIQRGPSM